MITTQAQFDLSTRNTFRMKVSCALYVEVTEEEDLLAIDWASLPQPVFVMGGGSNLLFTGDFPGTVLHIAIGRDMPFQGHVHPRTWVGGGARWPKASGRGRSERSERSSLEGHVSSDEANVTLGAGVVFDDFCAWAASEGLWGPENLSLIPGECGASAVQNIGAYGVEAKDIIADIRAYDRESGSFVNIDPATCGYGYRTSNFKTIWKGRYIITAVTYRLSRTPQPKLDYGGLRKVLEDRGVAVPSSGTCAPPHMGRGRGPFPKEMGGAGVERSGTEFPEEGAAAPLSAQIIRDAIIDIRRKKLPAVEEIGSAGSFFCNPVITPEHFERIVAIAKEDNGPEYAVPHYDAPGGIKVPAAWMIEQCGFKGRRNGGAQVYQNQPLVIVNASGTATPEDIIGLEQEVIKAIQTKYGITLHPEVEHI